MLSINWSDVWNVVASIAPQLIAIGVVLVLALALTIGVNKKTVKNVGTRKLIHSESWLVFMVAVVVAVSMMLFGPLASLLNSATATKYTLSETTISNANKLAKEIQSEAITMLKNEDSNLPLANKKINVFGWGSTNPVYGGTGSGSMNQSYKTTSLLDGLKEAGIETNTALSKLYTDYRSDRPVVAMAKQDWTLPEVPAADYSDSLISEAKAFSDEAMIVITRVGGEGADLPKNMKAKGITYTNNSDSYEDFKDGESFLELSQTEKDMVDLVTRNFDKVTVVYNGANTFELGFVDEHPQIKSVLWCPPAGQTGFSALGDVLAGETNPSGKTSDTFVKDLTTQPSYNNAGDFKYDNMSEFGTENFEEGKTSPAFVNYAEGIYVGYKYWETAADEGSINYSDYVQYPFGYGLSYTTFDQKMGDVTYSGGKVSFDVTVTNTGDKAGKDVVEVYYNPPYTNGGIEKASANLVAFEKTDLLDPGASATVSIKFDDDDMASYDSKNAKAYVLEQGDYGISVRSDSHTTIAEKTITVKDTITYDSKDNTHNGDAVVATNAFDDTAGNVTYLSRADKFANYAEATAAPTNYTLPDEYKAKFRNLSNYDPAETNNDSDKMPTTGAKNGVRLADLTGKDYDDELWDKLLDQLTFDQMDKLIAFGGYGTQAVNSIGKIALTDVDGPASLNNNFTGVGSIGFPSSTSVACTWNKDLARQFGDGIGDMAHDMHVAGWYAPAMNIHRNAFAGRTFEYFSEDGYLSGVMASQQVAGAQAKGVYAFMKHFALNDQETNRLSELATWANEQSIREIYLKPFEMSVKEGGAGAVMSAFNYIGIEWAGSHSGLLNTVLRDEWGFRGMVLTDYFGGYGYQSGDRAIRGGNDLMLATTDVSNHITDKSATSLQAMRTASHNILYTAANSWLYEKGEPEVATPIWKTITYVVWGVAGVLFVGLEVLAIQRYLKRRKG
ncbi:beta-glucosidase [Bifidobacterium scardovii]|uniref:Glycosyl hydrolase n=1 Tax=Bifidobacterium scardovii TaxID=158787 RepID=A0A087D5B7_9BIFI|nr:glycoside hydrolase family 3 N-terminal domain-containing protein [Bifidobacterium scardovii]KFI90717.1 glycosyl hydrolase [Bifidobacterium scardovii]MBS6947803.1 glycoside hydrolase family 3 C-terminal domain-containing protein [Bifidobacterium scardovii]MDK6349941.1 glycoside hydrolase family 3 N-terminal domain-containing protein [Bifidobacterium scardovii]MDU2422746.1 glycoside hydrolase family 3 N-terminal domain-containing protein [Bifidobacterium scardovii]MDU3737149.1 glycoside hydr